MGRAPSLAQAYHARYDRRILTMDSISYAFPMRMSPSDTGILGYKWIPYALRVSQPHVYVDMLTMGLSTPACECILTISV